MVMDILNEDSNKYYLVCLNFGFYQRYIIWISNDNDGVVVDNNRKILAFESEISVLDYASEKMLLIEGGVAIWDVYKLQQWLLEPCGDFDYELFLNFWNLCTDVSVSTNLPFKGDIKSATRNRVYDKLFAVAGPFLSDRSDLILTDNELKILHRVIEDGLKMLSENLMVLK